MGAAMRILQAGELSLDEPLCQLSADLPRFFQNIGFRNSVIDARYRAARNLFEAAITERVDLVLLAGKLFTNESDSRPFWFLQEQFAQLVKHRISVVCAETTNNFHWSPTIPLPENVRVIDRSAPIEIHVHRNNHTVSLRWYDEQQEAKDNKTNKCRISRRALAPDTEREPESDPGLAPKRLMKSSGSPKRHRQSECNLQLHEQGGCVRSVGYCLSSDNEFKRIPVHDVQASALSQAGPFQATLVEIAENHSISSTPIRTEAVACETLQFAIQLDETLPQLRHRLIEEFHKFESNRGLSSNPTLLRILLSTPSRVQSFSLNPASLRELLSEIQDDAGEHRFGLFPCRIEVDFEHADSPNNQESIPVQIAFEELADLSLNDVSENFDQQPLNINQKSFQRLKSQVALRIPNLLAE